MQLFQAGSCSSLLDSGGWTVEQEGKRARRNTHAHESRVMICARVRSRILDDECVYSKVDYQDIFQDIRAREYSIARVVY